MGRKLLTSIAVLVVSTTLRPISITAQQSGAQQSATSSVRTHEKQDQPNRAEAQSDQPKGPPPQAGNKGEQASTEKGDAATHQAQLRGPQSPPWFGPENASDWAMVILTVFGLGLGWVSLRWLVEQTKATKEAAIAAKDGVIAADWAFRVAERADVLIDRVKVTTEKELTPDTRVFVTFKNFGRTRATNVVIDAWCGLPDATGDVEQSPPQTAIASGQELTIAFPIGRVLSCQRHNPGPKIMSGKIPLRFQGTFEYRDIFGQKHTTAFIGRWHHVERLFYWEQNEGD